MQIPLDAMDLLEGQQQEAGREGFEVNQKEMSSVCNRWKEIDFGRKKGEEKEKKVATENWTRLS